MAALTVSDDRIDLHELDAEPEDGRLVHRLRLRSDADGDDEPDESRKAPHTSDSLLTCQFPTNTPARPPDRKHVEESKSSVAVDHYFRARTAA